MAVADHPPLHPPGRALIRNLIGHTGFVDAVALTPDGQRAVSASADTTVKVWDVEAERELNTLTGHDGIVYGVAMSADGTRAALEATLEYAFFP